MCSSIIYIFYSIILFWLNIEAYEVKDLERASECFKSGSYERGMRAAEKCQNEDLYHCLHHENDRNEFYEFCGDFITISPGTYPVFRSLPPKIISKDCVGDTYQDQFFKSSDLSNCFDKEKCNGKGQIVCKNGSKMQDRRCKCDITKNHVIKIYGDSPSNKMTCCPDVDNSCDCWPKKCRSGFVLNEVYQCVKKCNTSDCFSTRSQDVTKESARSTTGIASSTLLSTLTTSVTTMKNDQKSTEMLSVATKIFIGFGCVIVAILFAIFVAYICCHKPYNKCTTGSCDDQAQSDDNPETIVLLENRGTTGSCGDQAQSASAAGDGDAVVLNEGLMQVLFDVVAYRLPNESSQLGVYLGLPCNEIDAIKETYKEFPQEQIFQILWYWFSKNNNRNHIKDLNKILSQNLGRNDVVRALAEFRMEQFDYQVNGEGNGMKKITEKDCLDVSSALNRERWKLLRFLGLEQMTIERIRSENYDKIELQLFKMLIKWTEKDLNCTRNRLCSGLNYINRNDIINNLETRWGTDTPENASS